MSVPNPADPDDDELGPIGFLAIEFPGAHITAGGFQQLLSLAGQGVIGILDLEFITKDSAGHARKTDVLELGNPGGTDLSTWAVRRPACSIPPMSMRSPPRSSPVVPPSSYTRTGGFSAWWAPGGAREHA